MAFNIVHRGGDFEEEPSIGMFQALYDERYIEDDEHLGVAVGHESEWYLSLYPSGKLIWENVADSSVQPQHLDGLPKEKVIDLWTKLALGDIEAVQSERWLSGY